MVYKEVEFPAVSFCNLNPLRRSQLYLEENVDLVDVIATLDQATEDQLSGVSQSSRRRRRRRRLAVNDDVTATVESPAADLPLDKHRATPIVRNDRRRRDAMTARIRRRRKYLIFGDFCLIIVFRL